MSTSGSDSTTKGRRSAIGHRKVIGDRKVFLLLLPILTACPGPPPEPTPNDFRPSNLQQLAEAEARSAPTRREVVRFTWRSDDGTLQLSGQGAARMAPPDSVRVDMSAALGLGRAAVIMTGTQVQAQPPELVDRILPDRFALWALLGHLRAPSGLTGVSRLDDGDRTVFRVTDAQGRNTLFEVRGGILIGATREEGGRTTSVLRLTRGPDGTLTRAQLTDYARSLRLEVEVTSREASEPFAPETWRLR